MTRIREWVRSTHGDPLPLGLFIPFAPAYKALKEFIETDGELPKSIEWIANKDLPPNTFPEPWNSLRARSGAIRTSRVNKRKCLAAVAPVLVLAHG
jgi:Immunity protein Imm1